MSSLVQYAETYDVRPNAWLRRPRRIKWLVAILLGVAVAVVPMTLLAFLSDPRGITSGRMAEATVFALILAAPWLLFARTISRAGLRIGPDGIVIRGPLRTWTIPGNGAVSFSPGIQPSYGNGTPCPILTRADGSTIGVWALGREGLVWNFDAYLEEFQPLCDELNRLLDELFPEHPVPAFQGPS